MEKLLRVVDCLCKLNDKIGEKLRDEPKALESAVKIVEAVNKIEGFRGKSFDDESLIKYIKKSLSGFQEYCARYTIGLTIFGLPLYGFITHSILWTLGLTFGIIFIFLIIGTLFQFLYILDLVRE